MTGHPSPILSVRQVTRRFGPTLAVDNASFDLKPGRITCLLGPSGCGKSSLLRIIAGLDHPDQGQVEAKGRLIEGDGVSVPPEKRRIGLVFQEYALFPHLDAVSNVAFGLHSLPRKAREDRAMDLLRRFRMDHRASAFPYSLSGGEQQRVAIARALAPGPDVLLLDEPFSGLDGDLRGEIRDLTLSGLRESRAAVLVVTHDPEEAMLLGDELVLMAEGRIVQSGTAQSCYSQPRSAAAARLLGRANLLPVEVRDHVARTRFGILPAPDLPDGPALLMIRPEALSRGRDGIPASVTGVRFAGAGFEVRLTVDGEEAVMRLSGEPPEVGEEIEVRLDSDRAVLLPCR